MSQNAYFFFLRAFVSVCAPSSILHIFVYVFYQQKKILFSFSELFILFIYFFSIETQENYNCLPFPCPYLCTSQPSALSSFPKWNSCSPRVFSLIMYFLYFFKMSCLCVHILSFFLSLLKTCLLFRLSVCMWAVSGICGHKWSLINF